MMDSHPTGQRALPLVAGEQSSQQPLRERERHQQYSQQQPSQREQYRDDGVNPPDQSEALFTAATTSPDAANLSDPNAQQPSSEPAKKKRSRHRRRRKRRPSFLESQDTANPVETTAPGLDVPPQRPVFYQGSALSRTSLESEALLDHR
jgi:hypothetical protein